MATWDNTAISNECRAVRLGLLYECAACRELIVRVDGHSTTADAEWGCMKTGRTVARRYGTTLIGLTDKTLCPKEKGYKPIKPGENGLDKRIKEQRIEERTQADLEFLKNTMFGDSGNDAD